MEKTPEWVHQVSKSQNGKSPENKTFMWARVWLEKSPEKEQPQVNNSQDGKKPWQGRPSGDQKSEWEQPWKGIPSGEQESEWKEPWKEHTQVSKSWNEKDSWKETPSGKKIQNGKEPWKGTPLGEQKSEWKRTLKKEHPQVIKSQNGNKLEREYLQEKNPEKEHLQVKRVRMEKKPWKGTPS